MLNNYWSDEKLVMTRKMEQVLRVAMSSATHFDITSLSSVPGNRNILALKKPRIS